MIAVPGPLVPHAPDWLTTLADRLTAWDPNDLLYPWQVEAQYGVPQSTIPQWKQRGVLPKGTTVRRDLEGFLRGRWIPARRCGADYFTGRDGLPHLTSSMTLPDPRFARNIRRLVLVVPTD